MTRQPEKGDMDRRAMLLWGLVGASALVMGAGSGVLAQDEKGVERKVFKEGESVIPGFPKVRLRVVTFQPGAVTNPSTMKNPMVCECSRGSFESTVDGKTVTRKKGDVWTCKEGLVITNVNKGKSVAIMRVFDLLPA
ncbi:MAG: hypothetical protein HYZ81_02970 [Nitrospinae bacterium]|nr:hypothetical protein [Nitrospinota bacterium]